MDASDLSLLEFQLKSILSVHRTILVVHIDLHFDSWFVGSIERRLDVFRDQGYKIYTLPHRYAHTWGTATNLYVELSTIAYLFELSQNNPNLMWDYFINLSSFDFALKPITTIQSTLLSSSKSLIDYYKGTNHDLTMRYHPRRVMLGCKKYTPVSGEIEMDKIFKNSNFTKFEKYVRTLPLYMEKYAKGSPWYILTRHHALFLLRNLRMTDIFSIKFSYAPEDTFIQTILSRGVFSYEISKKTFRITGIDPGPVDPFRQNLTMKHWPILSATNSLFARKVSTLDLANAIADLIGFRN